MAENNISNVVESFMKDIDHVVGSKTVIGTPATVGDATIIPLVDVSFGVAAGAGARDKKNSGIGGMSAKVSPSAVLVIQNGHTKLMSVKSTDSVGKIADLIPEIIDKVKGNKAVTVDKEEAKSAAFPESEKE
ncbi:MAG: GerW family sporulation protein [Lachnospiraceae bacterium]|nr:GerW family sporulation protein [Lachnospiraceae bacterium]